MEAHDEYNILVLACRSQSQIRLRYYCVCFYIYLSCLLYRIHWGPFSQLCYCCPEPMFSVPRNLDVLQTWMFYKLGCFTNLDVLQTWMFYRLRCFTNLDVLQTWNVLQTWMFYKLGCFTNLDVLQTNMLGRKINCINVVSQEIEPKTIKLTRMCFKTTSVFFFLV